MFRYMPPKSSIWGHRLPNMPAKRANELVNQFLATAAGEYKFLSSSLGIIDGTGQIVPRMERLLGTAARGGQFGDLTQQQSAVCLEEIIKEEDQAASIKTSPFMFAHNFEISQWHFAGQFVATTSKISMHYGQLPCISTFLWFDTVEQFRHVKQVLGDLGLCNLNEKHLKPVKAGGAW